MKVLVVEDNTSLRTGIQLALQAFDLKAITASDGAKARTMSGRVDLLITDLELPDMNGVTLCAEFRAANPYCKTILMSGYFTEQMLEFNDDPAVDAWLPKPFSIEDLIDHVQRLTGLPEQTL